jgi:hypothetical protein
MHLRLLPRKDFVEKCGFSPFVNAFPKLYIHFATSLMTAAAAADDASAYQIGKDRLQSISA